MDTGIGNDKTRPAVSAWDHLSLGYLDNLAHAGITPEQVGSGEVEDRLGRLPRDG